MTSTSGVRITGVDFVVVPVDAFDTAVAFYGDVLGLSHRDHARTPKPSSRSGIRNAVIASMRAPRSVTTDMP